MNLLLRSFKFVIINVLIIFSAKAGEFAPLSDSKKLIIENYKIKKIVLKLIAEKKEPTTSLSLEELNIITSIINESQKEEMILAHDCEIAF